MEKYKDLDGNSCDDEKLTYILSYLGLVVISSQEFRSRLGFASQALALWIKGEPVMSEDEC
jgi:hypothetical protein